MTRLVSRICVLALVVAVVSGCGDDAPTEPGWSIVHRDLDAALLSVWGVDSSDVWAVGADMLDGSGPLVIHYDGSGWERLETGQTAGDLWWVYGFAGGPVFMGGSGGVILRYEDGAFTPMTTPGNATVFGIWGIAPTDMWAVGGASESEGGFALRRDGDAWVDEPALPADVPTSAAIWKVFGQADDDAWLVGSNGVTLHWDGSTLSPTDTGVGTSLFTVHGVGDRYAAVGGLASGIIVELDGDQWRDANPDPPPGPLAGVCLDGAEGGVAVGLYGVVFTRDASGWHEEDLGFFLDENFHATWIDPDGGVWAVGGQTFVAPYTKGLLIYRGDDVPEGAL